MSLNLTIVSPFGIWQCSDHRLVNTTTMRVEDDYSVKHVILKCPDGTALIAYAGIGKLSGVHVSDWMRETLRGEARTVDQSLIFLRENATRDLGPYVNGRLHHMFSVGAIVCGTPWIVQVRNFTASSPTQLGPAVREFQTVGRPLAHGEAFGFPALVSQEDGEILRRAAPKRPRKPEQFSDLLAAVNRRTANSKVVRRIVSRHCTTTYMPPAGEPFTSKFHDEGAHAPGDMIVPMLLYGIDTTEQMKATLELSRTKTAPSGEQLGLAVKPIDRLRRP